MTKDGICFIIGALAGGAGRTEPTAPGVGLAPSGKAREIEPELPQADRRSRLRFEQPFEYREPTRAQAL